MAVDVVKDQWGKKKKEKKTRGSFCAIFAAQQRHTSSCVLRRVAQQRGAGPPTRDRKYRTRAVWREGVSRGKSRWKSSAEDRWRRGKERKISSRAIVARLEIFKNLQTIPTSRLGYSPRPGEDTPWLMLLASLKGTINLFPDKTIIGANKLQRDKCWTEKNNVFFKMKCWKNQKFFFKTFNVFFYPNNHHVFIYLYCFVKNGSIDYIFNKRFKSKFYTLKFYDLFFARKGSTFLENVITYG